MQTESQPLGANVSLCDALDRILNKGVVATGDITVSVAGVDLLYIGIRGLICAIDALDAVPACLAAGDVAKRCEESQ